MLLCVAQVVRVMYHPSRKRKTTKEPLFTKISQSARAAAILRKQATMEERMRKREEEARREAEARRAREREIRLMRERQFKAYLEKSASNQDSSWLSSAFKGVPKKVRCEGATTHWPRRRAVGTVRQSRRVAWATTASLADRHSRAQLTGSGGRVYLLLRRALCPRPRWTSPASTQVFSKELDADRSGTVSILKFEGASSTGPSTHVTQPGTLCSLTAQMPPCVFWGVFWGVVLWCSATPRFSRGRTLPSSAAAVQQVSQVRLHRATVQRLFQRLASKGSARVPKEKLMKLIYPPKPRRKKNILPEGRPGKSGSPSSSPRRSGKTHSTFGRSRSEDTSRMRGRHWQERPLTSSSSSNFYTYPP